MSGEHRSDAGAALVNHVLGATAQPAADARTATDDTGRQGFLDTLATRWAQHDDDPLVHAAAAHLREHDDRHQFLAGLDIFLAGVASRTAGEGSAGA